jgi:hypothetical protein
MLKSAAPYVLITVKFNIFASVIANLKIPLDYVSTMGQCIRQKNFGALKSNNYHILMQ